VSAIVSVWDITDRLLLRSRTDPPARDEATLPGLPRFTGALRRDLPCRVPESGAGTSNELVGSGVSGCPSESGTGLSSDVFSISFSFPFPFPLGFRCDLGFAGLCFDMLSGTSSIVSGTGRGVPGAPPGVPGIRSFFQRVLADSGVLVGLCGDRLFRGVENDCRAWATDGCVGGAPGLLGPEV
jgi:hypothetical protein